MKSIQLNNEEKEIIVTILKSHPYPFFFFGSRTMNSAKPLSDLDIFSTASIPLQELSEIKEKFENSNLKFTVDVLSRNFVSDEFFELIRKSLVPIE